VTIPDESRLERDYLIKGELLWNTMITLLIADEVARQKMLELRDKGDMMDILAAAKNTLILRNTIDELQKVMLAEQTPEERAKMEAWVAKKKGQVNDRG
jgi:hypothetical protein